MTAEVELDAPATRVAALAEATRVLAKAGVPAPERDARLLLRWAAGLEGAAFSAQLQDPPKPAELTRFRQAITARADRRPVSHIIGQREFWGRRFEVTEHVLDPRPETEALIEAALSEPARHVLDLGTGSGCILITLLAAWPEATGTGVDVSAEALAVAERNAEMHGVAPRANWQQGNWGQGISETYDLIVSNPPYIPSRDLDDLAPEVRLYEPQGALDGGADGLDAYRALSGHLDALLRPKGRVIVEIGPKQAPNVRQIFRSFGLSVFATVSDLDGRPRALVAGRKEIRDTWQNIG